MTGLEATKEEAAQIYAKETFDKFKQKDLIEKAGYKELILSLIALGFLKGADWGASHSNNLAL